MHCVQLVPLRSSAVLSPDIQAMNFQTDNKCVKYIAGVVYCRVLETQSSHDFLKQYSKEEYI